MIKAISVIPNKDFSITVNLEDGRTIRMEMNFIFKKSGPVVDPLKNEEGFKKVFIRRGIVTWSTGYDIDPYFLISEGVGVG